MSKRILRRPRQCRTTSLAMFLSLSSSSLFQLLQRHENECSLTCPCKYHQMNSGVLQQANPGRFPETMSFEDDSGTAFSNHPACICRQLLGVQCKIYSLESARFWQFKRIEELLETLPPQCRPHPHGSAAFLEFRE